MSVYRRYFQIKDEATLAKIDAIWLVRSVYRDGLEKIKAAIGSNAIHTYVRDGRIAGFGFESTPDLAVFKKVDSGVYYPKKSNKAGKAICAEISKLKAADSLNAVLDSTGMHHNFCMSEGLTFYSASICGSEKAGWFAVVPWKDEDPAVLEQYKADRDAGIRGCSELDHLLWTPPAEWVEVKEWECKKAMDEARDAA